MSEAAFEFVEGATSDLSFVAHGASCEEALVAACEALLAATVENPGSVRSTLTRKIVLLEEDLDLLLLGLLNELVYRRDAEGLLLHARSVRLTHGPDGHRLEVELVGEPWCADRHVPGSEVKAATAHGLALRAVGEGWEARATLDV
jgi:SHS2 domain-containing protein